MTIYFRPKRCTICRKEWAKWASGENSRTGTYHLFCDKCKEKPLGYRDSHFSRIKDSTTLGTYKAAVTRR